MDVSLAVSGSDQYAGIALCLDKIPHQLTVLSHLRAVAQMCITHASDDLREEKSVKALKSFDTQLKRMQRQAIKAQKGKARMQTLPTILSPRMEAEIDYSDSESDAEARRRVLTESIAPKHDYEDGTETFNGMTDPVSGTKPLSATPDVVQEQATPALPISCNGIILHAGKDQQFLGSLAEADLDPCEMDDREKPVEPCSDTVDTAKTGASLTRAPHANRSPSILEDSTALVPLMGERADRSTSKLPLDPSVQQAKRSPTPMDSLPQGAEAVGLQGLDGDSTMIREPITPTSSRSAGGLLTARLKLYRRRHFGS